MIVLLVGGLPRGIGKDIRQLTSDAAIDQQTMLSAFGNFLTEEDRESASDYQAPIDQ
jgi:hypothetical protein